MTKTIDYLKASRQELKKVVWPSRKEVIQHTILVIAVSLGVAFFLGGIDFILTLLIEAII
ncbi:MAG: preprotein translocase subunit SecE [Candidatus Buchananbacteria bacterium RIFCSPLOWO2_01_FULL_56_15]|uniref:Protein translocase subunit SecE n=2 Tax=Candidatus Buchananiibacteriota TaxID=1817903 RepID=A0A1G1YKV3_9BACT|nr:MAG: preprotein translocase subunit SecE [Candidatus Buchananbacteria bacterium RIFCSPHIGHO2_02_FULL_56_16]OGY54586.1 MAG: preprotein translocase subunit SecE [Candidatus Buchananbacteria bacterium RIFCSPLOWO2_01_FULL_56_15]